MHLQRLHRQTILTINGIVAKILIGTKISATLFSIFGTKACLKGDIRRRISTSTSLFTRLAAVNLM